MKPTIDKDKCDGCGTCVDVCPADPVVFEVKDDKKAEVVNPDSCIECGVCEAECPNSAITLE